MAGLGDPLVLQVNKAVLPSVTVWSDGVCVNVGAAPGTQRANDWQDKNWLLAKANAKM